MSRNTKVSRQAQLQAILAGIAKHYANVTTVTIGGVSVAIADLEKLIQQDLDAIQAIAAAKATYAAQVQQERNARAKLGPTLRQFKSLVLGSFGDTQDSVEALADFGFSPRKSPKVTVATKAEAQVQSKATREARGTVGPKQKAKIKGAPQGKPATLPPVKA